MVVRRTPPIPPSRPCWRPEAALLPHHPPCPRLLADVRRRASPCSLRVAISALAGNVAKGESAFSKMLILVSNHGTGQAFLAVSPRS